MDPRHAGVSGPRSGVLCSNGKLGAGGHRTDQRGWAAGSSRCALPTESLSACCGPGHPSGHASDEWEWQRGAHIALALDRRESSLEPSVPAPGHRGSHGRCRPRQCLNLTATRANGGQGCQGIHLETAGGSPRAESPAPPAVSPAARGRPARPPGSRRSSSDSACRTGRHSGRE